MVGVGAGLVALQSLFTMKKVTSPFDFQSTEVSKTKMAVPNFYHMHFEKIPGMGEASTLRSLWCVGGTLLREIFSGGGNFPWRGSWISWHYLKNGQKLKKNFFSTEGKEQH